MPEKFNFTCDLLDIHVLQIEVYENHGSRRQGWSHKWGKCLLGKKSLKILSRTAGLEELVICVEMPEVVQIKAF
jgi:hypothetical protein